MRYQAIATLLLAALIALPLAASAAAAPPQRVRTGESRADLERDPRLALPISLSRYRIFVGELLERISEQTGVKLETDERHQPLSGYELTLVSHNRPAWEILDALPRLYSAPPERWYWVRTGKGGAPVYTLRNSLSAAELRQLREQRNLTLLLNEFRKKKAQNPPPGGAFSFVAGLTESQFVAILRGNPLRVPAAQFTQEQRVYLVDTYNRVNANERTNPLVLEGKREPKEYRAEDVTEAVIQRDESMGNLPALAIVLGSSRSFPLDSFSILKELQGQPVAAWRAPDEAAGAPEGTVPAAGRAERPAELAPLTEAIDRVLERLGQSGQLNVLYDRPVGRAAGFYHVFRLKLQGSVTEVLDGLSAQNLVWKRKDAFLYFRLTDWLASRHDLILPWRLHRMLRQAAAENNGFLSLEALSELALLSPEQREALRMEYPDAGFLLQDAALVSILQLTHGLDEQTRALFQRPEGSGWDDWSPSLRRQAEAVFGKEVVRTVKVRLSVTNNPPRPRSLVFGLSTDGSKPQTTYRALMQGRKQPVTLYPELEPGAPAAAPR